jgi:hypothetical protein
VRRVWSRRSDDREPVTAFARLPGSSAQRRAPSSTCRLPPVPVPVPARSCSPAPPPASAARAPCASPGSVTPSSVWPATRRRSRSSPPSPPASRSRSATSSSPRSVPPSSSGSWPGTDASTCWSTTPGSAPSDCCTSCRPPMSNGST